jgi:DNA-binding transcriptional ArsR family regulator
MSSSHKRKFAESELDAVFHALGHRVRRALLDRLASSPAMITELAAPFALSLPAVSRHLRVLEEAGLIGRTVEGRIHQCSLQALPLKCARGWLDEYRTHWESTLDSLARYVEKKP